MKNIPLAITLLVSCFTFSQSTLQSNPCATDFVTKNLIAQFPEVRERLKLLDKNIQEVILIKNRNKNSSTLPQPGSITIPVVIYIVHDGTALTNISDGQVNDQLTALNTYFFNTGIKFCLATKVNNATLPTENAAHVQTTTGIIHVNSAALSNHFSNSQSGLVGTSNQQITKERYLRIWVVKTIDGPTSGILGYSMFPNTSSVFDGIVMRYDVFGNGNPNLLANYNQGKVLVHEVGHYLALYHTFEGGCTTAINDCMYDGDHICDTPRVAAPNFNCNAGTNSCVETPAILDDLSNYMDYGNNLCQTHFSNGQIERMLSALYLLRASLISTENIVYTGTCGSDNLLSATITASNFTPCSSPTVSTTFSAALAFTYSWNFGDVFATGSNPNTSTSQTASHIYTSAANSPYTVTLTVTNSIGESRISSELIYVTNCTPILNANTYWYVDSASGLSFSSGRPVFDSTFPAVNDTNYSCNSQCDNSGNLLFYTSKYEVWNRQHQQINATNLMLSGISNKSNQVLCIAKPPATGNIITQYYIFTQQYHNEQLVDIGFRYNIVNVSGTDATMGLIAQPITLPSSYGFSTASDGALLGLACVSAVKKCDSNDYWILTCLLKGTATYLVVFSLSNAGLNYVSEQLVPNVSGTAPAIDRSIYFAPNGNKMALIHAYSLNQKCLIYDFNKAQGIISSTFTELTIPTDPLNQFYGGVSSVTFSPDSNLLYATYYGLKKIYQFNINSVNIDATRIEIASTSINPYALKIGPDNKIYVAMANYFNDYNKLSVINRPNAIASHENPNACYFSLNGPIQNNYTRVGGELPNTIDAQENTAYFNQNSSNVICKYITACNTYKFFPNVCGNSFVWTFTNTTSGAIATSTVTNPTYNFPQNGTYIITLRNNLNVLLGTSSPIIITTAPATLIDGSATACINQTNITNNSTILQTGETITWSITGGTGTITGPSNLSSVNISWSVLPGTIILTKINSSGCTRTATKTITSFCTTFSNQDFLNHNLTIYPNPSQGLYIIKSENSIGKVTLRIFDTRGRIVLNDKDFDFDVPEKTIDLSDCESGMYFLKLTGYDFDYSFKLLKN